MELLLLWMIYFSWVYWVLACWGVRTFFKPGRRSERGTPSTYTPPVSILKPVCGLDHGAFENFASFCRQDYPEFEIIFGVASRSDPAVRIIRDLQRTFPERRIKLVVGRPVGANQKVGLLYYMEREARHDVLVLSDSDMRVGPDYLRRVVAPLAEPDVGLVTCPYRGEDAISLPAKLEALHMSVIFLPSVVIAWKLGLSFALGATVVIRRRDLMRIGGFRAIADYLADDFQLGCRIGSLGLKTMLSNYVTVSVLGRTTFTDQWNREVRWAKCNRVSRPREYPGILLTLPTPLAGAFAVVSGFSPQSQQVLLISLVLRLVAAWLITGCVGDRNGRKYLFLLPIREMLSALVWFAGLVGRRIVWRGREYILAEHGKMVACSCASCADASEEVEPSVAGTDRRGRIAN